MAVPQNRFFSLVTRKPVSVAASREVDAYRFVAGIELKAIVLGIVRAGYEFLCLPQHIRD